MGPGWRLWGDGNRSWKLQWRLSEAFAFSGKRRYMNDKDPGKWSGDAVGKEGGVRKETDASRVVETVVNEFGRLDILINGAAGNFLVAPENLSPTGFKTVVDIDELGTFTMSRAAVNYLKQGGQGKSPTEGVAIINISATLHYF